MYHNKYRKPPERPSEMKRRRRYCGKVCYDSAREAERAIRKMTELGRLDPKKRGAFEAYFCKRCKSHHAGHDKFKVVA